MGDQNQARFDHYKAYDDKCFGHRTIDNKKISIIVGLVIEKFSIVEGCVIENFGD